MRTKYLLFAFYNYYPNGGMNDCKGNFNSYDEAIDYISKNYSTFKIYDYMHLVYIDDNGDLVRIDLDINQIEDTELEEDEYDII